MYFQVTGAACCSTAEDGKPQLFRGVLGSDQCPPPKAGARSTPKPVSPRQGSHSTTAVREAADQVPFPADALNWLFTARATLACLEGREEIGI